MRISEMFKSVQGEGISQGTPAFFIRLQGCNLNCNFCDTTDVWKRGIEHSYEQIIKKIDDLDFREYLILGTAHFVWTGGEPMLPNNQKEIIQFIKRWNEDFPNNKSYHEMETNGTIDDKGLFILIDQINCSPKISNSLMAVKKRINHDILKAILKHKNSWFKFVIKNKEDIQEMEEDYVSPLNIPRSRVILMPESTSIKTLPERTRMTYELAIMHGYRAISRGHILAWDKTTGV